MQKHWEGFQKALSTQPFPTTDNQVGNSGFLDLKPKNVQAKYDAMSPQWGGVALSESKGVTDVFKYSFMPIKK